MDALGIRAVLARTPGLRAGHVRALLATADGDLTRATEPEILARVDLPPAARAYLVFPDRAALDSDLKWIDHSGAQLLASVDPHYPGRLLPSSDSPAVLFVLGDPASLASPQLAMVGSRKATPRGEQLAFSFARHFAGAGLTITSGLALGIDAASHQGALAGGGQTVAVCGTGLDRVYPAQHMGLARLIRENGALVSEFPPGTPPRKPNFPRRNRLLSGLSLGTLVVEATLWSGSLTTAGYALERGRKVFAIPGPVTTLFSAGCHKLLQDGAVRATVPAEVLRELKIPLLNKELTIGRVAPGQATALDKGYEMLLDAVGFEPVTIDVLAVRTGLPGESIASMLLVLELEGRIAPYPGGYFGRIP